MSKGHSAKSQIETQKHITEEITDEKSENNIQIQTVKTSNNCDICVPGSVHDLVSYVLMEQETWFEPELGFLIEASAYFKRAIDISALYGIYSLPLSSRLEKIFVFESSPVTTWYLKQSIEKNQIHNVSIISRNSVDDKQKTSSNPRHNTDQITANFNLDESSKLFSLDNIDLVIINLGGNEQNVLAHALEFLDNNQPLIMHRRNNEERVNKRIIKTLKEAEYTCYYLIPGINILAPLEDISILESSTTNLFFCKQITAQRLGKLGLLAQTLTEMADDDSENECPEVNIAEQLATAFSAFPYANLLEENWDYEHIAKQTTTSHYQKSLYYYFQAHDQKLNANLRVVYLMEAFNSLSESLQTQADLPQLLSLSRISIELGLSSTAIQALSVILETFCSDQAMTTDEPFLSPHSHFDQVAPGEQFGEWVFSSVLQTYLWVKSFSSYFMDTNELQTLQGLSTDPFVQARTERAKQLLSLKLGVSDVTETHPVLQQESHDNLNTKFWAK